MFKALFNTKNQGRIIVLVGLLVVVSAVIAVAGKTEVVTADDGSQTIKRSIFGYTIGK